LKKIKDLEEKTLSVDDLSKEWYTLLDSIFRAYHKLIELNINYYIEGLGVIDYLKIIMLFSHRNTYSIYTLY